MATWTDEGKKTFLYFSFWFVVIGALTFALAFPGAAFLEEFANAHYSKPPSPTTQQSGNGTAAASSTTAAAAPAADWNPWIAAFLKENVECGPISITATIFALTLPMAVYWVVGCFFMVKDLNNEADGTLKETKNAHKGFTPRLHHELYRKAVTQIVFISIFSYFSQLFFFHVLGVVKWGNKAQCTMPQMPGDYESWLILGAKIVAMYVLTDVVFYTMHRLAHEVPFLYKNVHKVHHQWVVSYGVDAAACHPLEQLFVNQLTVLGPSILVGLPFYWQIVWNCGCAVNTVVNHSGYNVLGTVTHDQHHHFINCEYGTDIFLDKLCGTTYEDRFGDKKKVQ